jgi:hypothetical protein
LKINEKAEIVQQDEPLAVDELVTKKGHPTDNNSRIAEILTVTEKLFDLE